MYHTTHCSSHISNTQIKYISLQVNGVPCPCYCTEIHGIFNGYIYWQGRLYKWHFGLVWQHKCSLLSTEKKKKKSKPKDQHWLCLNFHVVFSFVCKKMLAPLQHEVSMHLHSFKFYIKRQPPPPPFFWLGSTSFKIPYRPFF